MAAHTSKIFSRLRTLSLQDISWKSAFLTGVLLACLSMMQDLNTYFLCFSCIFLYFFHIAVLKRTITAIIHLILLYITVIAGLIAFIGNIGSVLQMLANRLPHKYGQPLKECVIYLFFILNSLYILSIVGNHGFYFVSQIHIVKALIAVGLSIKMDLIMDNVIGEIKEGFWAKFKTITWIIIYANICILFANAVYIIVCCNVINVVITACMIYSFVGVMQNPKNGIRSGLEYILCFYIIKISIASVFLNCTITRCNATE